MPPYPGIYTAKAWPITITITDQNSLYGRDIEMLTKDASCTGDAGTGCIVNRDDLGIQLSTTASNTNPVEAYPITVRQLLLNSPVNSLNPQLVHRQFTADTRNRLMPFHMLPQILWNRIEPNSMTAFFAQTYEANSHQIFDHLSVHSSLRRSTEQEKRAFSGPFFW